MPRSSPDSSTKSWVPVWWAEPSTSVMTAGRPSTSVAVDDPRAELRADDAEVTELRDVQQRHSRRGGTAARGPVDLAVGEHRDVALHGRRPVRLVLPEDDAVDATELRFQRVNDLVVSFEVGLDLPAELDQPGTSPGETRSSRKA